MSNRTAIANEEWREVLGFENHYIVSDQERVARVCNDRGVIVGVLEGSYQRTKNGKVLYETLRLSKCGYKKSFYVHHLVAQAFLGCRTEGITVNHIDGNRHNNCASNLEYITMRENREHALRTGLYTRYLRKKEDSVRLIASLKMAKSSGIAL